MTLKSHEICSSKIIIIIKTQKHSWYGGNEPTYYFMMRRIVGLFNNSYNVVTKKTLSVA